MKTRFKLSLLVLLICSTALSLVAVEIGDTRESVIAELGQPQSQMAAGKREFLNYAAGRIEVTAGVVSDVRGDFSGTVSAAPSAQPSQATAPARSAPVRARTAHWWTNLEQAKARAQKENKRILALFTGSDWCPPCQQFEAEVAHDEQFAGIFAHSFVFFKNDWLRNTPQPKAIAAEVDRVKREYGVRQYPTLLVLNAKGEVLGEADWTKVEGGGTFKEIMIEAIDDTRKATKDGQVQDKGWWPF